LVGGTTWTSNSFLTVSKPRGLTATMDKVGGTTNVHLYITTAPEATSGASDILGGSSSLFRYTDSNGWNLPMTGSSSDLPSVSDWEVDQADNFTLFRGVALAPQGGDSDPNNSGPGRLSVGPLSAFTSGGVTGCTFSATKTYSVANPGTVTINWTATVDQPWVSLSSAGGSLPGGASADVTVSFNAGTGALAAGTTNTATVTFSNTTAAPDDGGSTTRPVTLFVDATSVQGFTTFTANGLPGGPFTPLSQVYTLTSGGGGYNWAASSSSNFVSLISGVSTGTSLSGTIGGCSFTNITIAINTNNANALPIGIYSDTISFSNMTAGTLVGTRTLILTVSSNVFFNANFGDTGSYTNGPLVGQNLWLHQIGSTFSNPFVITNGIPTTASLGGLWYPGMAAGGESAYRNLPQLATLGVPVYVGLLLTITNACPNPNAIDAYYITTLYAENDPGTSAFANYRLGARNIVGNTNFNFIGRTTGQGTTPWSTGTKACDFYTTYRVVVQTDPTGNNMTVYVDPPNASFGSQTPDFVATGSALASLTNGSFLLNQFSSGGRLVPAGGIARISVNTNATTVFNAITPATARPVANFSASPTSGPATLNVNFTDTSTGTRTGWAWDFGDGGTSTAQNPSHAYSAAGTYSVRLIAANGDGSCAITKLNLITVSGVTAPTASFNATTPTSGTEPLLVTFTNTTTGTAPITSFWTFGDGASVTNTGLPNVSHTYAAAGSPFTVSLLASNSAGTSSASFSPITVTPANPFINWQTHYFPGGGPSAAGTADPDGDGVSNTNEFLSGFNPTNGTAYAHIIKVVKSGPDMNITYLGANGDSTWSPGFASRTNVLEYTHGSGSGYNGNYSNNFVTATTSTGAGISILSGGFGTGTVVTVTDTGAASATNRYYRIRVIAP
jgi:PKD repeat protein